MRRSRVPSNEPGKLFAALFSAGCTTNMSAIDFRQAQVVWIADHEVRLDPLINAEPRQRLVDPLRQMWIAHQDGVATDTFTRRQRPSVRAVALRTRGISRRGFSRLPRGDLCRNAGLLRQGR
jgi:hypothetical protein